MAVVLRGWTDCSREAQLSSVIQITFPGKITALVLHKSGLVFSRPQLGNDGGAAVKWFSGTACVYEKLLGRYEKP
jgi:hypothetical protein